MRHNAGQMSITEIRKMKEEMNRKHVRMLKFDKDVQYNCGTRHKIIVIIVYQKPLV